MSWGYKVEAVPGTELEVELTKAREAYKETLSSTGHTGFDDITAAEVEFTVFDLVATGALGDPMKHKFSVSLVGHANPGHEPAEGWANDSVTISISQV